MFRFPSMHKFKWVESSFSVKRTNLLCSPEVLNGGGGLLYENDIVYFSKNAFSNPNVFSCRSKQKGLCFVMCWLSAGAEVQAKECDVPENVGTKEDYEKIYGGISCL